MYKFVYTRYDTVTKTSIKLVEEKHFLYPTCMEKERLYYNAITDHNRYIGHATITYIPEH